MKGATENHRVIGRIPVRNLWLLLLYASGLARFLDKFEASIEESPDLPTLIARLLSHAVDQRLRRNLSRGYRQEAAILSRVRGRIDVLKTVSQELMDRGHIACRFEEHTLDTSRNRLVRAALDAVSSRVDDQALAHRCRTLAGDLGRLGVTGLCPSRSSIQSHQFGRHDAEDRLMVTLSQFVFNLVLPTEDTGEHTLNKVERDEVAVRQLFEKAVGNFFATELGPETGWRVYQGQRLRWQVETASVGVSNILPGMQTDIVLEHREHARRIVIDTKFTSIFTSSTYRETMLKSGYIYQMYAYLRSQEGVGFVLANNAEGILLHPAIGHDVDETVKIQGHLIRFATVDLTDTSHAILTRLRNLPDPVVLKTAQV